MEAWNFELELLGVGSDGNDAKLCRFRCHRRCGDVGSPGGVAYAVLSSGSIYGAPPARFHTFRDMREEFRAGKPSGVLILTLDVLIFRELK